MPVPPRHPALVRPPLLRRLARGAAALGVGVAVLLVLALAALRVADWQPLVVLTGSMRPVISPGDLVVADAVPARTIRRGDIVTFAAPDGSGRTITHRVRAVAPDPRRPGRLDVRTQGDANPAGERWTVPADGTVRSVRAILPGTLALRDVLADGVLRGLLVGLLCVLVLAVALREIWRAPVPAPAGRPVVRAVRRRW